MGGILAAVAASCLAALFFLSELRQFVGEGPVLTDDRPLVEYFLSLPRDRDPDLGRLRGDVRRHVDGM